MMLQKEGGGVGKLTYRFSGGRQYDRCNCFNLRLMWRYVLCSRILVWIRVKL
ncbi:hypothetical protein EV401DRAFT_2003547, partial [Pisolithus croceorrhizus]